MRRIIIVACAVMLSLVLAAGAPAASSSELSINTRVAILENRMDSVQTSLDDLRSVPSQLARIEEQIRQLNERSNGTNGVLQEAALGIFGVLVGGMAGWIFSRNRR